MTNSVFSYEDFVISTDRKEVLFNFTILKDDERHSFTEKYRFDIALVDCQETYRLLRALHMASGISYYKIFVSQEIEHPYAMSTREADFWNTVFRKRSWGIFTGQQTTADRTGVVWSPRRSGHKKH